MREIPSEKIYADNNSTTPVDPRVKEAIKPFLGKKFGNPSSLHSFGREVEKEVEKARKNIANLLSADSDEVIFTSSGSEANNTALKGAAWSMKEKGNHIITTDIEHKSVMKTCKFLEKHGFDVTYLDVDEEGKINLEQLKEELNEDTILISVMMVNNEVGTIQPLREISKILKGEKALFHTDAVQALGKLEVDVKELGVDMMSVSSHKIYGPKGVGALYIRSGSKIEPLIHGGAQERNIRAGTENVPGIIGFGKAAELAEKERKKDTERMKELQEKLIKGIEDNIDDAMLNGPRDLDERLPGNVNFAFKYVEGESLILMLDRDGVAASTGSACSSESLEPSHVLTSMGLDPKVAHGSLRIGLGRFNTEEDVNKILEVLPGEIRKLREMSAVDEKDF